MPKSRGRRNPKKDKSARRRRPDRSPGRVTERPTGQVRMRLESVVAAILQAPAELAPVVGCAGVWMYNAAENHVQGNHCVDACLCISHALKVFDIGSRIEPVMVAVEGAGSRTLYGSSEPRYRPDGSFNGHVVLVLPELGRFLDPTIQQYPEVPMSPAGEPPLMSRLPAGDHFGGQPIGVARGDHMVVYLPVDSRYADAWRNARVQQAEPQYCTAGVNLASNVFEVLRVPDLQATTRSAPYPRLQRLLDVLGNAESTICSQDYFFRHPTTGAEVRLDEIR